MLRSRSPLLWSTRRGGRTAVDCADKLIARDWLIKMPTRRQRDPNAERRKYYSNAAARSVDSPMNNWKPSSCRSTVARRQSRRVNIENGSERALHSRYFNESPRSIHRTPIVPFRARRRRRDLSDRSMSIRFVRSSREKPDLARRIEVFGAFIYVTTIVPYHEWQLRIIHCIIYTPLSRRRMPGILDASCWWMN